MLKTTLLKSKYCSDVMKNHFNKELVMAQEDNENDVKVRDPCHITGKYGDSAHRDCNINFKLNQKMPAVL